MTDKEVAELKEPKDVVAGVVTAHKVDAVLVSAKLVEAEIVNSPAIVQAFTSLKLDLTATIRDSEGRRDEALTLIRKDLARVTLAVIGDGTDENRGLRGDVQKIDRALFGDGSNPDKAGICEQVRVISQWKSSWDRFKWLAIGAIVTLGIGAAVGIVTQLW